MFLTEKTLFDAVEDIVWELDCSYMDATLLFCERNQIDVDDISQLIPPSLKSKIMCEAMDNGLVANKSRLPL